MGRGPGQHVALPEGVHPHAFFPIFVTFMAPPINLKMKKLPGLVFFLCTAFFDFSCHHSRYSNEQASPIDAALADSISKIRIIDNHAHPNTIDTADAGADALPMDGLGAIALPARVRPESATWVSAYQAMYGFTGSELNEQALKELSGKVARVKKDKGENFPAWVLDQCGIDVMFANRMAMGPGLSPKRFRWVMFDDALLFPLSTVQEAAATPDRKILYPMETQHLKDYLSAQKLSKVPATLDAYLKQVVTPTLEAQKKARCAAIKFEVAYLRSLDFEKTTYAAAAAVYARNANGGAPSRQDYKLLQDYLFYFIAGEAGRLGLAVHIHDFPGVGNYYVAAGSNPMLLEPVFNDPDLRNTKFVLLHGGGPYSEEINAMLWKPNVYVDISLLTQLWTPDQLAAVLRQYLSQFPEKVLFGTDADAFGPGYGWELSAWIASTTGRQALGIALSQMMRSNELSRKRAIEIARMVMRGNANNLYHLGQK